MEYNTYPPDGDLGALVKCYWSLCISKEVPKGSQQVLSVGCMDMIFNLKPPPTLTEKNSLPYSWILKGIAWDFIPPIKYTNLDVEY